MHEVLVNRLGGLSLPRKSEVRSTDCPDMTLDVYHGRKTTTQQQQKSTGQEQAENGCYTSINLMSRNFGTTAFVEISKVHSITNNFQLQMTELEL